MSIQSICLISVRFESTVLYVTLHAWSAWCLIILRMAIGLSHPWETFECTVLCINVWKPCPVCYSECLECVLSSLQHLQHTCLSLSLSHLRRYNPWGRSCLCCWHRHASGSRRILRFPSCSLCPVPPVPCAVCGGTETTDPRPYLGDTASVGYLSGTTGPRDKGGAGRWGLVIWGVR